jgi:hypothetical protein
VRALALLAAPCLLASCARQAHAPTATDAAFAEGTVVALPVSGQFPRLGLQWTYEVAWTGDWKEHVPRRAAYRLTERDGMGHPWVGWWIYGTPPDSVELVTEQTGATIEDDNVFFHPPRTYAFRAVEWAPWPIASRSAGRRQSTLTLGEGWGEHQGQRVVKTYQEVGGHAVTVPAGAFAGAWLVKGESAGWRGEFCWVDRVGWASMSFVADDGRRVDLRLLDVRQVVASDG